MNQLRAPDPTLTQHATNDTDVVLSFDGDAPPIAHVLTDEGDVAPCGTPDLDHWCDTGYARWFAVPCRECFPDAPPPGYEHCPMPGYTDEHHDAELCRGTRDLYLGWQVLA